MTNRIKLRNLKQIDLSGSSVSLAIVKQYKSERVSQYDLKYVPIEERLENRLRNIIINQISRSNTVENYTYDCPEPEEDQVRGIDYNETDFHRITEVLNTINPEEDVIGNVDELIKAKAYIIILRNEASIQVIGFKTLPENWKMRHSRGLIPLLYTENSFKDLEDDNVFSISNFIDLFYYDETLFILSKKEFEKGLNFRDGMIDNAGQLFQEVEQLNVFTDLEILRTRVGNNQRYLRKIATIKNLGHYRNPVYLQRLQQVCASKGWNINFVNGQIEVTEESLDEILTLLQNKRLHSELTFEDFDVESAKALI